MKIWLNGLLVDEAQASLSIHERGFLLGDGIFTTLYYNGDEIECFCGHLERLQNGANLFKLPFSQTMSSSLETDCLNLLKTNGLLQQTAALRITLSRGIGPRGIMPPIEALQASTLLITAAAYQRPTSTVKLRVSTNLWMARPPLSTVKHLGYQLQILGRLEAFDHRVDDVIFYNTEQHVVGTSHANIFAKIKGQWCTPPLSSGALPGLMRGRVLREEGPIQVRPILIKELEDHVEDLFLTNSLIGKQRAILVD